MNKFVVKVFMKAKLQGFTLIELMVVVAVIAILAMIAYPSYTEQVRKSRRGTAQACLMELAQFMERYYTTNMTYKNATLPNTDCTSELTNFYTFDFTGTHNATEFTIKADPTGAQAGDRCGTMTINYLGDKTAADTNCW